MKKYIMIILVALCTMSLSFSVKSYAQEPEKQLQSSMNEDYLMHSGSLASTNVIGGADTTGTSGDNSTGETNNGGGSGSGSFTGGASGGLFSNLINSGAEIFEGMKSIIFAVSGLGIVGVAIGGFFGNLNWKWLSAIIIGLMVIAGAGGILQYIAGDSAVSSIKIQDSLKNAG